MINIIKRFFMSSENNNASVITKKEPGYFESIRKLNNERLSSKPVKCYICNCSFHKMKDCIRYKV